MPAPTDCVSAGVEAVQFSGQHGGLQVRLVAPVSDYRPHRIVERGFGNRWRSLGVIWRLDESLGSR